MDLKDYGRYLRRLAMSLIGQDHLIRPDASPARVRLGSDYGGWVVATAPLERARGGIVYSFGLGCDITFDLAMVKRFGCRVFGFDPTPLSLDWLSRQSLPENFRYYPLGIADYDGTMTMGIPDAPDATSFSVCVTDNRQVECDVRRIGSIMAMLGHSAIAVLKMDIEGGEYAVLDDILKQGVLPTQLLVEFHHNMYGIALEKTFDAVARIRNAGYKLISVSLVGREFSFVRSSALAD